MGNVKIDTTDPEWKEKLVAQVLNFDYPPIQANAEPGPYFDWTVWATQQANQQKTTDDCQTDLDATQPVLAIPDAQVYRCPDCGRPSGDWHARFCLVGCEIVKEPRK